MNDGLDISITDIFGAAQTAVPIGTFIALGGVVLGIWLSVWLVNWASKSPERMALGSFVFAVMAAIAHVSLVGSFTWQTIVVMIVGFFLFAWCADTRHFLSPEGRREQVEIFMAKKYGIRKDGQNK